VQPLVTPPQAHAVVAVVGPPRREGLQGLLSGFLYRSTFHPEIADPALLRRAFEALVAGTLRLDDAPGGGSRDA